MEYSTTLLMQKIGIDEDCATGAAQQLLDVGAAPLKSVDLISSGRGYTAKVIDQEDNTYYLGFGGLGYLEIIRQDSATGEILYAPTE